MQPNYSYFSSLPKKRQHIVYPIDQNLCVFYLICNSVSIFVSRLTRPGPPQGNTPDLRSLEWSFADPHNPCAQQVGSPRGRCLYGLSRATELLPLLLFCG